MRLVGFNLTKIDAEKFSNKPKDLKIETAINIDSIEENSQLPPKDDFTFLDVDFKYTIEYSKDLAKIELGGKILISIDSKKAKEIIKDWKSKKIGEETKMVIFNGILMKSNIRALQIEDELGLPPHFRLPSLQISDKDSK